MALCPQYSECVDGEVLSHDDVRANDIVTLLTLRGDSPELSLEARIDARRTPPWVWRPEPVGRRRDGGLRPKHYRRRFRASNTISENVAANGGGCQQVLKETSQIAWTHDLQGGLF